MADLVFAMTPAVRWLESDAYWADCLAGGSVGEVRPMFELLDDHPAPECVAPPGLYEEGIAVDCWYQFNDAMIVLGGKVM